MEDHRLEKLSDGSYRFRCHHPAAWLLRDTLTLANFAMIYILVVLVFAIRLGTRAAMSAAFISFLCINFFLTRPYYTFIVADTRDVIELMVFIVVAALSGQLGARARRQADDARQRAYEQEILYRLTGSMNQRADDEAVYEALTHVMREDLRARQAYILPYESEPQLTDETVLFLLLQAGERIYGTLCVAFDTALTDQQVRLLRTCAAQAAMALQRIELAERARVSQQYEEADRLKTAILHAVSHDLRTPITIIKTSASNLRTLGERLPTDERQELSETIETEADHLEQADRQLARPLPAPGGRAEAEQRTELAGGSGGRCGGAHLADDRPGADPR